MSHLVVVGNSYIDFLNLRKPLLDELRKNNSKITLMGPKLKDQKYLKELTENDTTYISFFINPVNVNPLSNFFTFLDIVFKLKSLNPDKLLLFTLKPIVFGSIASFFLRNTKVFSLNSGLGRIFTRSSVYNKFVLFFLKPLLRLAFKFNERVIFQNKDDRELFAKHGISPTSKSLVVNGTGIDLERFKFLKKTADEKPLKFLMISRLIEEKGLIYYYQAAKIIKKEYPEVTFFLLGNFCNSKSGISPKIIESWQKANVIDYLGETNDVRPYLNDADIFVLPTYYREGVPRTCMEALATGLPIITSDVPGCKETVKNNVNGFLIKPKSSDDLQNAMRRFIKAPQIIEEMSKKGRKLAEDKFDIIKVNNEIVNVMR